MENLPNEFEHNVFKLGKTKKVAFYLLYVVIFLLLIYFLFISIFSAPADFPLGAVLKIEKGSSLRSVSATLEKEHLIRSRVAFESLVIMLGGERHLISANYLFENKISVFEVAGRVSRGEHRMAPVVVTIPEGFNRNEIAEVVALKLTNFNKDQFIREAKEKEGYLFPDTYFFLNNANEIDVIKSMSENFNKKITSLLPEISSSRKTEKDIIILASIIEKEAKGDVDRGVVSGILWKRISIGMPLQVDVAPETYKAKGLPKSPIGNPGLEAITAAIHPQSSPYLYYLHDKDGSIYYAKTFSEHRQNILKYLK